MLHIATDHGAGEMQEQLSMWSQVELLLLEVDGSNVLIKG
jgi:hypothetical protein